MFKQLLIIIAITVCSALSHGAEIDGIAPKTEISGQWFMAYNNASKINQFVLKRGYFTIKTKIDNVFSVRYTQDITLDQEGGDTGNVEMRLKYLYLKIKLDQFKILKNSHMEVGLVHRPWLDFEQNVNKYRVQGKMFLERYSIINSADFGLFFTGLLGGHVSNEYQQKVKVKNPGKYGSFALGVHNGGGYHAFEQNNNKTLEGRISIRPFSEFYPGLQCTYAFTFGKANTKDNLNDFIMNLIYVSSETQLGVFTGQYFKGVGDFSGKYVGENNESFSNSGYSLFGELNIPKTNFSLFGRFDEFKLEDSEKENSYIGGIAYKFLKSKVLLNIDQQIDSDGKVSIYELALEIGF